MSPEEAGGQAVGSQAPAKGKDRAVIGEFETELSRTLREFDITMVGVGAMIGAGVFVLTGIAAGITGPALMLAFALNGAVTLFTAMVYAELGSAIPEAGGGYLWVKEALGRSQGFMAGWMSWFSHAVAGSLYALGFGSFAHLLLENLGISLFGTSEEVAGKVFGVAIALLFLAVNFRGASETGKAGNVVTVLKVAVILVFVLGGIVAMFRQPDVSAKFEPFFPEGFGSVLVAMGVTYIAFEGYEIIVQAGEEVQNPRKTIPRAIFKSLMIVVPIYVLVAITAIGAPMVTEGTTWEFLGSRGETGLVEIAPQFLPGGGFLLLAGGLLSTMSALNATTFSSTRVSFAMGRDKVLPAIFGKVHPGTKTPYVALAFTGALIIGMAVAIPIEDVAAAADVMFLLLFLQVNFAVIRIRGEFGDRLTYGYRMPFFPAIPIIAIVLQVVLAVYLFLFSALAWLAAGLWLLVGAGMFAIYARGRAEADERPRFTYEAKAGTRGEYKVLVPIANPSSVPMALRMARALTPADDEEIIALNVVLIPDQLPLSAGRRYASEAEPVLEAIERFEREEPGKKVSRIVGIGHQISQVVNNVAEREEADVTLLGWKGEINKARAGGSVDQAVITTADNGVIVVKDNGLPEDISQVVLGVGENLHGREAVKVAARLALGFNANLRILSIVRKGEEANLDRHREVLGELVEDAWEVALPAERISTDVVRGDSPVDTLRYETAEADLLVIGASRDWAFRRYLMGSNSDDIANRMDCSVVVFKHAQSVPLSFADQVQGMAHRLLRRSRMGRS